MRLDRQHEQRRGVHISGLGSPTPSKRLSPCGFLPTGLRPGDSQSPHGRRKHIPGLENVDADEWRTAPCGQATRSAIP